MYMRVKTSVLLIGMRCMSNDESEDLSMTNRLSTVVL
jgi:hypothetical protein